MTLMRPVWSWTNHLRNATLTAAGEASGMPVANLAIEHRWQKWRSLATTTWFGADLGDSKSLQAFALTGTNWSDAATVRLRLSASAVGDGDVLDTGTIAAGVDSRARQWIYVLDAALAARYMRLDIADDGNSDGFVEAGIGWAGPALVTSHYQNYGSGPKLNDLSTGSSGLGGATFIDAKPNVRVRGFTIAGLSEDEAFDSILPMLDVGSVYNVLYVPRPGHARQNVEAIVGLVQRDKPVVEETHGRWAVTGEIRERL